jgi:hypothetical protein
MRRERNDGGEMVPAFLTILRRSRFSIEERSTLVSIEDSFLKVEGQATEHCII